MSSNLMDHLGCGQIISGTKSVTLLLLMVHEVSCVDAWNYMHMSIVCNISPNTRPKSLQYEIPELILPHIYC